MNYQIDKTFCEFFAGIGLVRAGLEPSGWRCVYANDVSEPKKEMYDGRFGLDGHFHLGDVWETPRVVERMTETPFLATASFPCTDMSLAGKGAGFGGSKSSAFFGFTRALDALGGRKPKLVLLENVTAFITSRGGADFAAAMNELAGLGYWVDAFVLDAKDFVPQSRPRAFVVGVHESMSGLIDRLRCDWMNEAEGCELRPERLVRAMGSLRLSTGLVLFRVPRNSDARVTLRDVIDLDDSRPWWSSAKRDKHYAMMSDQHRESIDSVVAAGGDFVGTAFRRTRRGRVYMEVRFDGVAGCLRTPKGGSANQIVVAVVGGEFKLRNLSPAECARLQGAGGYPLVANVNQNLYGFGDAVCVPAVSWIDRHVLTPAFDLAG